MAFFLEDTHSPRSLVDLSSVFKGARLLPPHAHSPALREYLRACIHFPASRSGGSSSAGGGIAFIGWQETRALISMCPGAQSRDGIKLWGSRDNDRKSSHWFYPDFNRNLSVL